MDIHRADKAYRTRSLALLALVEALCGVLLWQLNTWLAHMGVVLHSSDPGTTYAWLRMLFTALGLGHAVLCAKPVVGDEPFAVLLPADLIWNRGPGALKQMSDHAQATGASVLAVQNVPAENTGSYGIVATDEFTGRQGRINAIVEKPDPKDAPSTLAVVGRYVLSPRIFDLLEQVKPGAGGEIQLTDAIAALLQEAPVDAYRFKGTRFDCGTHIGLIEATIRYALDHEKLSEAAARTMQTALDELGVVELK